jgi:hypothetical protein
VNPAPPTPGRSSRIIPTLLALLALTTLVEIGLRVAKWPPADGALEFVDQRWRDRSQFVPDLARFWRLAPGPGVGPQGLRGADHDAEKLDRHLRVAVVGSSLAYGEGATDDDSVAGRIERLLQREVPAAKVEVQRLGVPGYSSHQAVRLWQEHGPRFAPDLVVLCCDLTVDAEPAVHLSDSELSAHLAKPERLQLARAWQEWRRPKLSPAQLAELRDSRDATHKPRVPLAETRRNVEWLIDQARQIGAEVYVCIPPIALTTEAKRPAVREYAKAVSAAATARDCILLDFDETIRAYARTLADLPPCGEVGTAHGFLRDDVLSRPSLTLVAEMIAARMRTNPRFDALSKRAAEGVRVDAVEPSSAKSLAAGEITVRGQGFTAATRVWLGERSATAVAVVDANTLRVGLPTDLLPGRHPIWVSTRAGAAVGAAELAIAGPTLTAKSATDFSGLRLELQGAAPAGARVQVFAAPAATTKAVETPAGPFWLRFETRLARWVHAPFCFESLDLPSFAAVAAADGTWQVSGRYAPEDNQAIAALQAVIWLPGEPRRGVVTELLLHQLAR